MAAAPQPQRIVPRRLRGRVNPVRAGAIALLIIVVGTWLAFTKELPWRDPFQFHAVFQTSNNLRLDSPVRIAGVNVGEVVDVEREEDSDLVKVTMEMKEEGLPIHKDATLKIRSRIFLEGNFFVDLAPGTPGGEEVEDGGTIPVTRTSTPVQLDELLTALQTNDRERLQDLLNGLGDGLSGKPSAADDRDQDSSVKGETAAQSLNDSLDHAPESLRSSAAVNRALLGTEPRDLSKLIAGLEKITTALSTNEEQLKSLITNFNRFFASFAAEEQNLNEAVRLLGPTVEHARDSLTSLNDALPDLAGFARDLTPGVRETQATIRAVTPWLSQAEQLFGRSELGGLLDSLRPATASLARAAADSRGFLTETNLTARCFNEVILPAGDTVINEGPFTTGASAFKEFWYVMTAFASEAQTIDGNGSLVNTATAGGDNLIRTGKLQNRPKNRDILFAHGLTRPLGTRPDRPARKPKYEPDKACYKNAKPNLNGPAATPGPPDQALRSRRGR
jgi:phospholipid/cholesterol/gamma-HCH transport system substrate-binding protein